MTKETYYHPLGEVDIPRGILASNDPLRIAAHYFRGTARQYDRSVNRYSGYGLLVIAPNPNGADYWDAWCEAQWSAALELFQAAGADYVSAARGSSVHYGDTGWVMFPLSGPWLAVAAEILDRLESYPVLDDELLSRLEHEELLEDILRMMREELSLADDDALRDLVADQIARRLFDDHSISAAAELTTRRFVETAAEVLDSLGIGDPDEIRELRELVGAIGGDDGATIADLADPRTGFGGNVLGDAVRRLEDQAGISVRGMLNGGLVGMDQTYWLRVTWSDLTAR